MPEIQSGIVLVLGESKITTTNIFEQYVQVIKWLKIFA
jgi:hypothetical protein